MSEYADDDDEEAVNETPMQALTIKATLPTYGARNGWKPTSPEHFGDGGAYPECHIAQYPLDMGRKKVIGFIIKLLLKSPC